MDLFYSNICEEPTSNVESEVEQSLQRDSHQCVTFKEDQTDFPFFSRQLIPVGTAGGSVLVLGAASQN